MEARVRRIGWLLALAVFAGPTPAWAQDRVVALHPVELPPDLAEPAPAAAALEAALTARLKTAGAGVVPAAESGAIWKRLVDEVQGFYDPLTGDTVATEYDRVHRGTLRELAATRRATHWLRARVEVVRAGWEGGKARWDGASEGVAPVGRGTTRALTLVVAVEDTAGHVVARGRGGLQVLAKVKGERYAEVPRDKLFADAKRIGRAVDLALADWPGGSP